MLFATVALAPAALAAPDSTTGGVQVPEAPTGGTEGGASLPQSGQPAPEVNAPAQTASPARASQAGAVQPPARASQNGDEGDVEVEVPIPPDQQPQQPTAPAQPSAPIAGLASTGFAAGLLGFLGLMCGAIGLTLLRMSAPARLRRRAQRREVRERAGSRHPGGPARPVRAR